MNSTKKLLKLLTCLLLWVAILLAGCSSYYLPPPPTVTPFYGFPPPPTVTPFSPTEMFKLSPSFQAVTKENVKCFFGYNQGIETFAYFSQFLIVDVIGKNYAGGWILVRVNGLQDCWVETNLLILYGDVSLLPIVTTAFPSISIIDTPSPVIATDLEVTYKVDVIECACRRRLGKAIITLTISNGIAPYYINNQEPVFPVLGRFVTFDTVLGIRFTLKVSSSDGKRWQDTIIIPSQCSDGCGDTAP